MVLIKLKEMSKSKEIGEVASLHVNMDMLHCQFHTVLIRTLSLLLNFKVFCFENDRK